jgi:hypothetical protein
MKYVLIHILAIAAIIAAQGMAQGLPNVYYCDNILQVYNSTTIETANYQYVQINNTQQISYTEGGSIQNLNGSSILISEIRENGPKSLLADVYILN